MIRTILLGFILISFLNCKPQKEKEVNDKINTPKVKELKSDTLKKTTNKASKNDRTKIQKNNIVFISLNDLKSLSNSHAGLIELVFKSWENNPEVALKNSTRLIFKMKVHFRR